MGNVYPSVNENPDKFLAIVHDIIMKTEVLQELYVTPMGKDVKWIELLVQCAPKLELLKSLTINSCVNIDAHGHYAPMELVEEGKQADPNDQMNGAAQDNDDEINDRKITVNRMSPESIEVAKAYWVHEEFLRYADVFRGAFPALLRL